MLRSMMLVFQAQIFLPQITPLLVIISIAEFGDYTGLRALLLGRMPK